MIFSRLIGTTAATVVGFGIASSAFAQTPQMPAKTLPAAQAPLPSKTLPAPVKSTPVATAPAPAPQSPPVPTKTPPVAGEVDARCLCPDSGPSKPTRTHEGASRTLQDSAGRPIFSEPPFEADSCVVGTGSCDEDRTRTRTNTRSCCSGCKTADRRGTSGTSDSGCEEDLISVC